MYLGLHNIIREAKKLPCIPLEAVSAYYEKMPLLIQYVDDTLSSHESIAKLIGNNPFQVMYQNHKHHASFMVTVFNICNYELMARITPWVYRTYVAHRFSYDYFSLELKVWIDALDKYIDKRLTSEIKLVYFWMLDHHENMIFLSQQEETSQCPVSDDWNENKASLQAYLLEGNYQKCLEIAKKKIENVQDVENFYLYVVQPTMYEIGMLWERGVISVAQEHIASAIIGRILAEVNTMVTKHFQTKGKVVVTAVANELHEIGAWMISDVFEWDGWDVRYLGANTPLLDLLDLLHTFHPHILALSVTMPFNILQAKEIISAVKKDEKLKNIRVMVGGRPFNETVDLWNSIGADGCAHNIQEAKQLANKWQQNGT